MAATTSVSAQAHRRLGAVLVFALLGALALATGAAAAPSTGLLKIGGAFPAGVNADNFQYIVLQSDRAALIPALKAANPQLKVLVYKDMAAALSWAGTTQIPAGVSMREAEANPDWFLTDTTGKRIEWCDYGGDWQLDVGKGAYQERWAGNVAADMRANGWDGVFIDDANASQAWHLCGRTIAKYPTDASYAAATRSFLASVGPSLTSQGFLVIPNIYLPYSADALATWLDWISFTSGGMQEYWSKWGNGTAGHFAGNDWTYRQQFLSATQRAGKIFLGLTYAPSGDVRSMRYARSTFLLDWDGGRSALLLDSGSGADPSSADWMADIGTPRGSRYPVGDAWRRDYSAGTVLVNPSPATVWVSLGSPHVNQDGQVVSSLALAPATGAVLRALGAPTSIRATSPLPAPVVRADFKLRLVKQGRAGADLYWSGVPAGAAVDVFRDGRKIAPLAGERSFTYSSYPDRLGGRGKVAWRVCLAGTASCSNTASLAY